MTNKILTVALMLAAAGNAAAQEQNRFKKTKHGLEYMIVHDAPGTKKPKLNDIVEMNIITRVGDSILFDSRQKNNNEPVTFALLKPQFNGDMPEGIMLLTPGDSAVFRVSIDSMKTTGAQFPEYFAEQKFAEYDVKLVAVRTPEEEKARMSGQVKADDDKLQAYFTKHHLKPSRTASGLYYIIHKQGQGALAGKDQVATVNYTGSILDGKIIDSNTDSAFGHTEPMSFKISEDSMIPGFIQGVKLLKKGGKGTFYIPSALAYGAASPADGIPENSILVFDIEVTDLK